MLTKNNSGMTLLIKINVVYFVELISLTKSNANIISKFYSYFIHIKNVKYIYPMRRKLF